LHKETREYRSFREELDALANWLAAKNIEIAVMESTGVYWKSLYEALEQKDVKVYVVNARYVKQVPGRKTDVLDSEWLAELARCGLLKLKLYSTARLTGASPINPLSAKTDRRTRWRKESAPQNTR
jgi:transposase